MKKRLITILILILSYSGYCSPGELDYMDYTDLIIQLQFLSAKDKAAVLDGGFLTPYYGYISDFFVNAGQEPGIDSTRYRQILADSLTGRRTLYALAKGVYLLFNSEDNSEAFVFLSEANRLAKEEQRQHLVKLSNFAILELYYKELTLVNTNYGKFIDEWRTLMTTQYDEAWYYLHRVIYVSKKADLEEANKEFPKVSKEFDEYFSSQVLNDEIRTYYYSNKAITLRNDEEWELVIEYFQKTIDFGRNLNFARHDVFMAHLHLVEGFSELEQFEMAEPLLNSAKNFWDKSDKVESEYLQARFSSLYYYEKTGKYDSAFFLMKKADSIQLTMDYRKNSLRISELNVELEVAQREKEIVETKKTVASQFMVIMFIIVILVVITALLLILYKAFTRIKEQNHEITLTNNSIQEKNFKIETLMKELHHRVKNNLQIISSLLGLQSMKLKDETAKKAVAEGKERIRAMSLIHQRLYQNDLVTSLNIRDYIADLVDDISKSYGDELEVELNINVPSIEMDADNAMPIGLIINELVTNAYKYAFKDHDKTHRLDLSLENISNLHYQLILKDNGQGFPDNDLTRTKASFGMKLVTLLVNKQLKGMMEVTSEHGVTYKIQFPIRKLMTHENNKSIDR
ncbi:MAG: sensor histidine kinase [Bacteroidota bacterium]